MSTSFQPDLWTQTFDVGPGFDGGRPQPGPFPEQRSSFPGGGGGASPGSSFFSSGSLPAPVLSGVAVTPETALTFTAWYACIDVRSTDLASLPLVVKRKLSKGGQVPVPKDPRYNLVFCEPNEDTTSMRFRQSLLGHRHGWGNGYASIDRLKSGLPGALLLESPRDSDTWPERSKTTKKLWYATDGGRKYIRGEDMIHTAGLGYNGIKGYSLVALHRQAMGYGLAMEQHGAAFYGNAATPRGALKVPKKLTPEMLRNLRESFNTIHQDTTNAHRLAILEEGMEYQAFSVDPKDAEYVASRQFQVVEMCRIMRVPPPRIMHYIGASSVYGAFESFMQDYISSVLAPDAEGIEQELNRKLFTKGERARGLHVAHDFTALLRGNLQARADYYTKRFSMASITPDEIREREGDNPTDNPFGRQFFLGTSYKPLEATEEPDADPDPLPTPDEPDGIPTADDVAPDSDQEGMVP